jgi:hypothetical protein
MGYFEVCCLASNDLGIFPDPSVTASQFNSIVFKELTLFDLNSLKCVEVGFTV